jgi:hypothetical protein
MERFQGTKSSDEARRSGGDSSINNQPKGGLLTKRKRSMRKRVCTTSAGVMNFVRLDLPFVKESCDNASKAVDATGSTAGYGTVVLVGQRAAQAVVAGAVSPMSDARVTGTTKRKQERAVDRRH